MFINCIIKLCLAATMNTFLIKERLYIFNDFASCDVFVYKTSALCLPPTPIWAAQASNGCDGLQHAKTCMETSFQQTPLHTYNHQT